MNTIELICQHCEKSFPIKPSRAKRSKYCSKACFYAARRNRIDYTCEHCGVEFSLSASRAKYGRGKHCSPECQYAAIKARRTPARIYFICQGCGVEFFLNRSTIRTKKGAGKYCSRPCRDANRIGKQHPQYINGGGDYRGPNWQAQKRKARKRDSRTCQHCQRPGQSVHHIRPYRLFDGNYEAANNLSNLVTLCGACHRVAEAAFQASER